MMPTDRRSLCRLSLLGGCLLFASTLQPCAAREPIVEFLRGLVQRGYGEQALDYLYQVASRPDLPPELKQTLDLERSKALRMAADEANDAQQRRNRLAEAKRLAEKFFAENPEHPAAPAALLGEGDETFLLGQNHLAHSHRTRDTEIQEKALADARAAFTSARDQFDVAASRLKAKLESLPPAADTPGKSAGPRDDLEFAWVEARFKQSLSDYYLAQTYSDPKEKQRRDLLNKASAGFDALYREYRGKRVSLFAHLWHGRALEDLGDTPTAVDHYDEVLVAAPVELDPNLELAPLFGQAQLLRLKAIAPNSDPRSIVEEGEVWLTEHNRWQATPQYQGIALEVAKARLKAADKIRGTAEKAKFIREALASLAAIGKVDTEHRREALQVRREAIVKIGAGGALSIEECLSLGDEAAAERNWTAAEELFRQAIDLARKANDSKRTQTGRQRLAQALYQQAIANYAAGKMDTVLSLAGEVVRDNPNDPVAEEASVLAIAAALQVFADAADGAKEAALSRLQRVADYAIQQWPGKPVADDAHMALAQAALIRGYLGVALQRLGEVTTQSKRYPSALYVLGQVRWKQYLQAKRSEDADERASEIQKLRAEAVSHLQTSLDRQRAVWQPGSEPIPATLFDTQLLLAETHLEGNQQQQAAALFQELVEAVKRATPAALGIREQRALAGATRAHLAVGNVTPAADAGLMLAEASPDDAQPNSLLVELARLVGIEARRVEGKASIAVGNALRGVPSDLRDCEMRMLELLASRQALTVPQLIYIGDACVSLEKHDNARQVYQRLLETIDKDESAKATAGAATTRIRARLVGLLRSEGQLDEAFTQVTALLKTHPTALEPLMEKGYILQSLAERDPRRLEECVAHWTDLRLRLARLSPRPPEFFEVLYNAALCLARQARHTNGRDKALQAEQMLKSTMTLSPKLSGPDMVAKYEALLKQTAALRAGLPAVAPAAPAATGAAPR